MRVETVIAFLILTVACDGKQFRPDYEYSTEAGGWFKLHIVPAKWENARLRCFFEGAVLASPLNSEIAASMRSIISTKPVYTGIHATISPGDYFSVEEMSVTWAVDQPDNKDGKENCLVYFANGNLADVDCSRVFPYICYKREAESMEETECGTVDKEYKLDNRTGSCYKFHRAGVAWPRAMMACAAEGGYLAIINSEAEAQVLRELFAQNPSFSITAQVKDVARVGFYNWAESGIWGSIHGHSLEQAGYAKWGENEPNNIVAANGKKEQCGGVFRSGLLDNTFCDYNLAFICEKPPTSNSFYKTLNFDVRSTQK